MRSQLPASSVRDLTNCLGDQPKSPELQFDPLEIFITNGYAVDTQASVLGLILHTFLNLTCERRLSNRA